jgi:hypothetical protein
MTVSIRQIHPVSVFAGEVSGIDITKPLTRDEVAAIEALDKGVRSGPDPETFSLKVFDFRIPD